MRLFKISPTTNAYEAVDGGAPLGCVLMSGSAAQQILVYNSQRVPQAMVTLTCKFAYSVRDLYISFADGGGASWSVLFDGAASLQSFLFALNCALCHLAGQQELGSCLVHSMPSVPQSADDSAAPLTTAAGMSVGIYLTVYELADSADAAAAGQPLKSVQRPDDVLKVKLGGEESLLPGLAAALLGRRRGEVLALGVPPQLLYKQPAAASYCIDPAARAFPMTYLLAVVEVAKIKSSSSSSAPLAADKKAPTAPKPVTPAHSSAAAVEGQDELTLRMAKLSKSAGAAPPAAAAAAADHSSNVLYDGRQQHQAHHHHSSQEPRSLQPQQPQQQQQMQQQPQMQLALVEGEGARSYYLDPGSGNNPNQQHYTGDGSNHMHSNHSSHSSGNYHGNGSRMGGGGFMEQQQLMQIQQSLMQLHGKLDHMGMQQQQQMMMPHGMNMGSMGMGMQQMYGFPMASAGGKGKGDEAMLAVRALVSDYEQLQLAMVSSQRSLPAAASNSATEQLNTLNSTISKLHERNDALQVRLDKLMGEKADLLEKQAVMLQGSADQAQKLLTLQREVDRLTKAQQTSSSMDEHKVQQLQQEANILREDNAMQKQQMEALQGQLLAAQQSAQLAYSDRLQAEQRSTAHEQKCATLSAENADLQRHLVDQAQQMVELTSAKDEAVKLATATAANATSVQPDFGGVSSENFRQAMQHVYVSCGDAFSSDSDVAALIGAHVGENNALLDEIETVRTILQQSAKTNLKRLRDVIRQVTADTI